MATPILGEVADGVVDGFNRTYRTARSYKTGSLRVWVNGILGLKELTDGWAELSGNKFRLEEAPRVGDQVQVYYLAI